MSVPQDIHERVHAFADGELSPEEADDFRLHLGTCERCQQELGDVLQLQALGERLREAQAAPERARTPSARSFRPAWHRRHRALVGVALAAAAVAAFILATVRAPHPTGAAPAELLALAPTRSLEARLSHAGASAWRPYDVKRSGGERPSEPIPLKVLAQLEERGDWHGMAIAQLLRGEPGQAAEALRRATATPDLDSDRAAVALSRGALEEALLLLDGALARAPRHPQALWNRGLVLRELGLSLLAAEDFTAVAELGEPGWSGEARQRAELLRTQQQAVQRTWEEAWKAGIALATQGTPLPPGTVRATPGLARTYLYQALWAAPSAERARALLPLARELDALQGNDWLERYVTRTAARDFRQRGPLAERFGQLVAGAFDGAHADAYLDALRRSSDTDILLGALPMLHRLPARLADYERAARALGDPWFLLNAELEKAKADFARSDLTAAEARLTAALEACRRERAEYRCIQLESLLTHVYKVTHRLVEARAHADAGLQLARQLNEASLQSTFLVHLGDIAGFRNAFALARAYLREQALRQPTYCAAQSYAHESLAALHIFGLAPREARAELEKARACGEPLSLVGAATLADLARMDPRPGDVEQVQALVAALRARGTLRPAELAMADHLEGRALLERDSAAGRAVLRRAIATAERLLDEDLAARKARAYSYTSLLLDAGQRGAWAEALGLFAEEQGAPEPGRCTLGVEVHDERTLVVARGADGREVGHADASRTTPGFEVTRLVPPQVLAALEGCERVGVFARHPVHGQPGLLPPHLAWSYFRGRAPEAPRTGPSRQLAVHDVEAPRALELPRLQAWRTAGAPGRVELRGAEATPSRVLAELADATEVEIHAHGLVNLGVSEASLLVLSPEANGRYALTAGQVRRQRLTGAPVVLLAACHAAETAPYLHAPWSLPVAFLDAGARAVIASPGQLPDAEAGTFFEAVLARLRAGEPAPLAVRDERLRFLQKNSESWVRTVIVFE